MSSEKEKIMSLVSISIGLILIYLLVVYAIPKPNEEKDNHSPLNKKHYENEQHNKEFDHEAFLGEDESKSFDQLPPEESKRRLGIIASRIDKNGDKFIDVTEIKDWIEYTQRRYIDDDVERQWKQYATENNKTIPWEVYRKLVYGFMDDMDPVDLEKNEGSFSYNTLLKRDRRRWNFADTDTDDELTKEEFKSFLHPEEDPKMSDVVLIETIEDIDKNNDGKISVDEYIGDMYRSQDSDDEPDWVKSERDSFAKHRDKNNDGYLDKEEVKLWIKPVDYNPALAEAKHLVYEADENDDQKLSEAEVLNKYDLFVGSQATDFGEALIRHDEF